MALAIMLIGSLIVMRSHLAISRISSDYSYRFVNAAKLEMETLVMYGTVSEEKIVLVGSRIIKTRSMHINGLLHYRVDLYTSERDTVPFYALYTARIPDEAQ